MKAAAKAAILPALALAAALPCGTQAQAQHGSGVQLYGIVDAAVRHSTREGTAQRGLTRMLGGGMSRSRWGLNLSEDLGGGLSVVGNLENQFSLDDGTQSGGNFFQLSWFGLRSAQWGRITLGRQYTMLFDLVTSTYASFPYTPYLDTFRPEVGMQLIARASNIVKYWHEIGPLRVALQYSPDEKNTHAAAGSGADVNGALKTAGGYLRYAAGGLAVGAAWQRNTLPAGSRVDGFTLGGSWRGGPWYLNAGFLHSQRKHPFPAVAQGGDLDRAFIGLYWQGAANGGFLMGDARQRRMLTLGAGWQMNAQWNLGAHWYRTRQNRSDSGAYHGHADFAVAVANYSFSKRTSLYAGLDHARTGGGTQLALDSNGARQRSGLTLGWRHWF